MTLPPALVSPYRLAVEEVLRALETDIHRGLAATDADRRLQEFGPNELPPPRREAFAARVFRHLREPMALLLMAAAGVSGIGLGERKNALAIVAIVILNVVIGLIQEGRATRAMEALRTLESPTARVVRDGSDAVVPAKELVPGDIVVLSAGDRVPADLRLALAASLQIDESLLTGESLPASKDPDAVGQPTAALGEQRGMAFSGSLVTRGSARGVIVATGPDTELGSIAAKLAEREPPTPLQRELAALTARLGGLAVAISAVVFGLTLLRMGVSHASVQRSFLSAVALAVAAVPEGLATVVTIGLALGVRRMAAQGAIIRRLPAVETLGSTTILLTDKTGTLTQNRMRLEAVALPGGATGRIDSLPEPLAAQIAQVAALCNDATLEPPMGDPLEVALLEAVGARAVADLRRHHPRLDAIPFESERRRMTTLHRDGAMALLLMKGAAEEVTGRAAKSAGAIGRPVPLSEADRAAVLRSAAEMAGQGMRVLALARRELPGVPADLATAERDLELVGLVGLRDPARPEAVGAVAEARSAGIQLRMVTGDHAGTARAIASEVGLGEELGAVVDGATLRRGIGSEDLPSATVYARVDPDQKLELVEAFQARGHVVAVTGDGVNDAPALKRADIGVAMGRSGSDVAREAADMVITDDNLATIVAAIREGRGIYDNIRKVVDYLVAGNLSEITVVVSCLLLFPALGIPLLPLQLLWVNLLTDGFPALALGVDPADPALMLQPPRAARSRLLSGRRAANLFGRGLLIASSAVGSLAVARFAWDEPWAHARAVMFTVLVVAHLLYAFAVRRATAPASAWLPVSVVLGIVLQLGIVVWAPAHEVFGTASLSPREWLLVLIGGILPVTVMFTFHIRDRRPGAFPRASRFAPPSPAAPGPPPNK
jgi:Ca2+-transporting ATPase